MAKTSQAIFSILALVILAAAVLLTMAWISPLAPLPAGAPATEFSAGRAMQDLHVIAREPHPMGISTAHADVRDYLLEEIRALGLEPQVQDTFGVRVAHAGFVCGGRMKNILVRLPGSEPEGAILLIAHYDSTPGGPGGSDNGSGVVTILEILRALHAGAPLRHDVIVFFSDGEEPCAIGAHAFVAQHPWFGDVRFAINVDTLRDGPPMLLRTSQGNGTLVQALARSARSTKPAYISFPFHLFPSSETDLFPFLLAGVAGADIAASSPRPEHHTALDRPEVVDPGSVQQAGSQMLALVRTLGNQHALESGAPDETCFPILGMLVHYPASLAWPLATVAGLCFLGTMFYGLRRRELTWRGLGLGLLTFLLTLAASVLIANLAWQGILASHPEYGYVGAFGGYRQTLSDDSLYAVGFIVLALAVAASAIAVARRSVTALDLAAGALLIWFPLTITATVLFPAASYLLTWVLLAGSLALLLALVVQGRDNAWVLSGLGFLASAILATWLWMPLVNVAIVAGPMGADFPLLSLLLACAVFWLGAALPALDLITGPKRRLLPAASLLAALGLLLAGHFVVGKDSPPPLVNPIGYWLDANEGKAYWVAFSGELDGRQADLLVDPVRQPYTDLFPETPPYSVLTSAAPLLDLDGPRLEVLADEWMVDRRVVRARITTSMHDRVYVIIPPEPALLAITVPHNERTELPPGGDQEWMLRFDGMPVEGIEIGFELSGTGPVRFLLVEERTGLPSFPELSTQPEPGTMKSPGEFSQGIPTDFAAINRNFEIQEVAGR